MIELIKIANSQLVRTPNHQVVKVAGILRQLKNWIKSQISSDFRKQVNELEMDSAKYSLYLEPISQQISKVQEAIKDKELEEYKRELLILKKLISEAFSVTNRNLNTLNRIEDQVREAAKEGLERVAPVSTSEIGRGSESINPAVFEPAQKPLAKAPTSPSLPRFFTKEVSENKEIVDAIKLALKEEKGYDLEIGRAINKPFKSINYYNFLVNDPGHIIYDDTPWEVLIQKLEESFTKSNIPKSKINKDITFKREILEPIVKKAIANGTVIKAELQPPKQGTSKDGKPLKNPATGVVNLQVESEAFNLPGTNLKSKIVVNLRDETPRLMGGGDLIKVWRCVDARTVQTQKGASRINFYQEIIKNAEEESILMVPGIEKTSPEFRRKLISLSKELGTNPDWLAAAISKESMFKTYVPNPIGAVGLIQFLPATQAYLYNIDMKNKTPEEKKKIYQDLKNKISSMSDVQQLDLVKKYFQKTGAVGRLNSPQSVYSAIFFPLAVTKDDDFVIADQNSEKSISRKIYKQNKGIDKENTGLITKRMLGSFIESAIQQAKGKRITIDGKIIDKAGKYESIIPSPQSSSTLPVAAVEEMTKPAIGTSKLVTEKGITVDKFVSNLQNLLRSAEQKGKVNLIKEAQYKKNNIKKTALITVKSDDKVEGLEYANALSNMIINFLSGTTSIHAQNNEIQVQASVYTNENLRNALIELSDLLSQEINNKINKNVYTIVAGDLAAYYPIVEDEELISSHRKFIMRYS